MPPARKLVAKRLAKLLTASPILDAALSQAQHLNLNNWYLTGGVVRDSVWSVMEARDIKDLIQDIDLIYYDLSDTSSSKDKYLEAKLIPIDGIPWSVKNQARMHIKSKDAPYLSTPEALYCAPETISTVGVTRTENSRQVTICAFGYDDLLKKVFRPTPHFMRWHSFEEYVTRVQRKGWLNRWPTAQITRW